VNPQEKHFGEAPWYRLAVDVEQHHALVVVEVVFVVEVVDAFVATFTPF